jgi:RNA polymerase sigma factor (sigma-70 family)
MLDEVRNRKQNPRQRPLDGPATSPFFGGPKSPLRDGAPRGKATLILVLGTENIARFLVRFFSRPGARDGLSMSDDEVLLHEYARTSSESAFAELVRRHIDLVYSTALRGAAGDEHLAQDVSQSVFIDLARKAASLSNRSVLAGWLYTSTCFAVAKAVRGECRRRKHEQEAQAMQEPIAGETHDPDWEQIGPVLNSVMLDLNDADREALLLRFFERCSLAEVGRRLGLNENAARMRVERALERLRGLLRRRGVTSSAAALGWLLARQAVSAAPAGLAAAITSASLASAAAAGSQSLLGLLVMSKAKIIAISALVAAGAATPVILQYQTNTRLRAELDSLRAQMAQRPQLPAATDPGEAERWRREHEELMRLRGEVSLLRQRVAATPKTPSNSSEFERLKQAELAKMATEAATAQVLLAKSPDIPMIPAASWVNAGFATPASALQTLNWAAAKRDTNAFFNAVSWDPQARANAEALFAALPDSVRQQYGSVDGVIIDWMLSHATPIAAFRVLSQTDQGPDDVTLVEQHQYTDDRVRENPVQFHRDENGAWRQVLPPEMMPKLGVVINNLAGAPPTGGGGK